MTSITIQDLQKTDLITELDCAEISTINGGLVPLGAAIGYGAIVAGGGLAGVGVGYFGTRYLDNK